MMQPPSLWFAGLPGKPGKGIIWTKNAIKRLQNLWHYGSCGNCAGVGMPVEGWRGKLVRPVQMLTFFNHKPCISWPKCQIRYWHSHSNCEGGNYSHVAGWQSLFFFLAVLPPLTPVFSNCTHEAKLIALNNPGFFILSFFWQGFKIYHTFYFDRNTAQSLHLHTANFLGRGKAYLCSKKRGAERRSNHFGVRVLYPVHINSPQKAFLGKAGPPHFHELVPSSGLSLTGTL